MVVLSPHEPVCLLRKDVKRVLTQKRKTVHTIKNGRKVISRPFLFYSYPNRLFLRKSITVSYFSF